MRSLGFAAALAAVGIACSGSTSDVANVGGDGGSPEAGDSSSTQNDGGHASVDAGGAAGAGDGSACGPSTATPSTSCYVDAKCTTCGVNGYAYACTGAGRPNVEGCADDGGKRCCPAACSRWTEADSYCAAYPDLKYAFVCALDDSGQPAVQLPAGCYLHGQSADHYYSGIVCCRRAS